MANPVGRPTIYTEELANAICMRISNGESLRSICKEDGMPHLSTILEWNLGKKEFSDQYARACNARAEHMFEELLEIADDSSKDLMTIQRGKEVIKLEDKEVTNRSRLRVDTRKWYLSKVLPKKFGEKLDLTSDGKQLPAPIYGGKSIDSGEKV